MTVSETLSGGPAEVFIACLPDRDADGSLFPPERQLEVMAKKNLQMRKESYFAWRLFELAALRVTGQSPDELGLKKVNGRWSAENIDFSISHSGGAIAVAISSDAVGVDIEPLSSGDDGERIARRFFNKDEIALYLSSAPEMRRETFLRIWTAKEAIFKSRAELAFAPSDVDSRSKSVYTEVVSLAECDYVVSVATECPVIIHSDIVL